MAVVMMMIVMMIFEGFSNASIDVIGFLYVMRI